MGIYESEEKDMTKLTKRFITASVAMSLLISGCSLGKPGDDAAADDSAAEATSFNEEVEAGEGDSAASEGSSEIVVFEDLFEPDIDLNASEGASDLAEVAAAAASVEKAPEKKITMVFFGDSQFANGRFDGSDIGSIVAYRVPNSVSINLGIGGTTAALELTTANYQDYENWTSNCFVGMTYALAGIVDRNKVLAKDPDTLENMNKINPEEVDYYFIEYGANDFFNKIPLDKYSSDQDDIHTYYGALCIGIETLKKISPNAKFILVYPFYGIYKDTEGNFLGDSYVVSNGIGTLADYAKKAGNVSEVEDIYSFDSMFMTKADLYKDTTDVYLSDGIHLSLLGRQAFARLLAHFPNWLEGYEPYAYLETDKITISEFNPNEYYRYRDDMLEAYYPENYQRMMNGEYLLAPPQ